MGQPPSEIALKVYLDARQAQRSDREVQALKSISSPSVVELLDAGTVPLGGTSLPYLVTRWVDGETLALRIARGALPERDVLQLSLDVADAIEAFWNAVPRLVHRDLKPANIMWTPQGRAVVIDLGLARHVGVASLSGPNERWGTSGYRAPEQVTNPSRVLTVKADVFALGVTLQEALAGRHPTPNDDMIHAQHGGLPTRGIIPGVRSDVADWIDQMVCLEAHKRLSPLMVRARAMQILGTLP